VIAVDSACFASFGAASVKRAVKRPGKTDLTRFLVLLIVLAIPDCSPASWQPWNNLVLPPDLTIVQHTELHAFTSSRDFDSDVAVWDSVAWSCVWKPPGEVLHRQSNVFWHDR
jgi:hypothetical protein